MAGEEDWPVVMGNLRKGRKSWAQLTRILAREGADMRVSGMFFKVLVQAVLLFGSETWVLTPCMERSLGSFQHSVARMITGRHTRRQGEGGWEYPTTESDMEEAVF